MFLHADSETLIRLGGCLGWSESSLGTQDILLVLSCGVSFIFLFLWNVNNQHRHIDLEEFEIGPNCIISSPELKAHKMSLQYTNGLSSSTLSNLNISWSQLASLDQILCVASLGWGKGCIRFWGILDQNSGFHGNRKPPLIYDGENDVSTFSRLFWIRSFLYLQVTRTCIKSRTSLNFSKIEPLWS